MKPRVNQVITHLLCSLAFLLFPILSSPDFPHVAVTLGNPNGLREVVSHVLLLGFFYLCYAYLIPRFYYRQRYLLFYTWIIAAAFIIFFILFGLLNKVQWQHHHIPRRPATEQHTPPHPDSPGQPPRVNILRIIFFDYSLYMLLIVLFLALLLKNNQRWRKLRQEQLETELSYLKAQINPHFLFNTLNSIYSLAIEKSDYTATAVVKLSGMMRYLISESNKHFVSLEKEIGYIGDYIELQQFRLGATVRIQYTMQGKTGGREIAPLILITFVENAFKYGVNPEEYSEIMVAIVIENDVLALRVENNKVTTHIPKTTVPGLGIDNTRNRLEMLYPSRHRLLITEDAVKFKVYLEINLI